MNYPASALICSRNEMKDMNYEVNQKVNFYGKIEAVNPSTYDSFAVNVETEAKEKVVVRVPAKTAVSLNKLYWFETVAISFKDKIHLRADKFAPIAEMDIDDDVKERLKDRHLVQQPYGGAYQQVNLERSTDTTPAQPYLICYAAEKGCQASFLLEMSGNRTDVHALVINTDTVVEICLAAVTQCLAKRRGGSTC